MYRDALTSLCGRGLFIFKYFASDTRTVPLQHMAESVFSGPFCFASANAVFSSLRLITAQLLVSIFCDLIFVASCFI